MQILSIETATAKLNTLLPHDIHVLKNAFISTNFKLFVVGGAVRDVFLGQEPKDFDICTDATPDEIINILNNNNIQFNIQGEHFGVIVAKLSEDIEIATFRTDTSLDTGNNQDTIVKFGATIEEDCFRRDLTINALLLDLSTNTIIDLVGGIQDLNNGIIKCIGNPNDRFKEDNLRKLRVLRFATRLNFKIDNNTFNAIKNDNSLNISEERIINELIISFNNTQSKTLLKDLLFESRLIFAIFPNMQLTNTEIKEEFTFNEFLAALLFPDELVEQNLTKLKFSTKTIDTVLFINELVIKLVNNEIINPLWFFKQIKKLSINKFNFFIDNDKDKIEWLLNFKPDPMLAQQLMDNGFNGIKLGQKIEEHYLNLFSKQFRK